MLRRLFGHRPNNPPMHKVVPARQQPGPVTAREALALALEAIREVDPRFSLTMITTGNVSEQGQAFEWDILVDFRRQKSQGVFTLRPCESDEIDTQPLCLAIAVRPAQPGLSSIRGEPARPSLPLDFIDSPAAVAALAAQGANFISGPSSMPLSTKVLDSGRVVWRAYMYDDEYQTPFTR